MRSPLLAACAALAFVLVLGSAPASAAPPSAPVLSVPYAGSAVALLRPPFVVQNATDPDGDPLTYEVDVATDQTFATIEHHLTGTPRPGAGHTILELAADLGEDSRHCWRARAHDGTGAGESRSACFRVSTVNDPPAAPDPIAPADGVTLPTDSVLFSWAGAIDPEGAAVTYELELRADTDLEPWTVEVQYPIDLERLGGEDGPSTFHWRVRALDPDRLAGPYSVERTFTVPGILVDTSVGGTGCVGCRAGGDGPGALLVVGIALVALRRRRVAAAMVLALAVARPAAADNHPPQPPVVVSPFIGEVVPVLHPVLIARQAVDDDGDPLLYDWQLSPDPAFTIIEASGQGEAPTGASFAGFDLPITFVEDSHHCWRVRAADGQATSAYTPACFVASAVNAPPTVPVVNNPSDQMGATTTTPVFSWQPSTDLEGEPITYDVELADEAGATIGTIHGVNSTVTAFALELENRATYHWRVRAVDRSGAASELSPWATFTVNAPVDNPEVVTGRESPIAGCSAGGSPSAGALVAVLLALALRCPASGRAAPGSARGCAARSGRPRRRRA